MITTIEIQRSEPLAGGMSFGDTGGYLRLIGIARGAVDPADPANRAIADLDKAPRNAAGLVEYQTDIFILRPADPAKGNGRILYEVNNRGRKLLFANLCEGTVGNNDPNIPADLGNALPLKLGFTVMWSGWDPDAPRANAGLALNAPVACVGGKPIEAVIRDEFVSGTRGGVLKSFRLSHDAVTPDPAAARLTVRRRQGDTPRVVPSTGWSFIDARSIRLLPEGTTPEPGSIHELEYRATNAKVQGLGFAATRDLISHLRYDDAARVVTGRTMSHALAIGFSQGGRYLRHHIGDGFNRDERGRKVFDGVLAHTAGIGRVYFNVPFGQPARTNTQHEDHEMAENAFPFSPVAMTDPLTGDSGGLLRGDGCDPLLIQTNTSTEYWQKGAALLHTDPLGQRDIELPAGVRAYLIAGTQHTGRAGQTSDPGPCANPRNPHDPMPALRALLLALDRWVTEGQPPPPSRVPRIADGTLVAPGAVRFPALPGVAVARFGNDIAAPDGKGLYRPLVPQVDGDGNETSGIRLPDIAVPRGTHTGWNLYAPPYPEGELADRDGSFIAFAATRALREQAGDPRPSLAERYPTGAEHVAKVRAAADALVRDALLLPEDAARYVLRAGQIQ